MTRHDATAAGRAAWRARRLALEAEQPRMTPAGPLPFRPYGRWFPAIATVLRLSGMMRRGRANALAPEVADMTVSIPGLPAAFENYSILHLSDLHLEGAPELVDVLGRCLPGLACDLAVLTGDYQTNAIGSAAGAARLMADVIGEIRASEGVLGILGNHDSHAMVDHLEELGVTMLVNETITLARGTARLHITGTDDVHAFYTDEAHRALHTAPADGGARIALVHTPDLATEAANAGFGLYLCGHTHGGQICLPGGRPLVTALDSHHHLASGAWQLGAMQGYTSRGVGAGRLPVRFNCPGELVRLRLVAAPESQVHAKATDDT